MWEKTCILTWLGFFFKDLFYGSVVVVHTLNPSTLEAEWVDLCEFETNLVYIANSRMAKLHTRTHRHRHTQRHTDAHTQTETHRDTHTQCAMGPEEDIRSEAAVTGSCKLPEVCVGNPVYTLNY